MVFHVKNTNTHKKIIPTMVFFFMLILTMSILLVQISPVIAQGAAATLTGTITDTILDTDDDGIPDELVVGVEVDVNTAGTFRVEISGFVDSSSNTISISNQNSTALDAGTQVVYVSLSGANIYSSKINPREISSITLYNESGTLLDTLSDTPLNNEYFYTHFGIPPAYLTGTISDEGVDNNDDGSYDELLIGVEVNVTAAGTFTVEVFQFYGDSNIPVEVSNQKTSYLDTGIQVVDVSIDGSSLFVSGTDFNKIIIIYVYDNSDTAISKITDVPLSETYSYLDFQYVPTIIRYDEIQRDIVLDQAGTMYVSNVYSLTNQGFATTILDIDYPEGAFDFQVRDAMGTREATEENGTLTITLRESLDIDESETIYVVYSLPWDENVAQQDGGDYTLTFSFTEQVNSTIETLAVSITLPKGAKYESANMTPDNTEEVDLQKILNFQFSDVEPSEDITFEVNYKYNVFWGSFYPTLWIGVIVVLASAVFVFWGTPKTISAPSVQVPTKDIKSFVDTYEERTTIQSELASLEERLKKGKIPRRRYKVRKKMLDGRISNLSRTLSTLRGTICASGSKYSNMMNQLEVAEAKLGGAQRDKKRVKSRYSRGEISKDAYGKLLEEYQSRIESAESTIDGVLLRLRD